MDNTQWAKEFESFKQVPMPVFVCTGNGDIIQANDKMKELFSITSFPKNLNALGCNYSKTSISKEPLYGNNSPEWKEENILQFLIDGKSASFKAVVKTYYEDSSSSTKRMFLLSSIQEFEHYKDLEKILPVGIFKANRFGKITNMNSEFAKLFLLPDQGTEFYTNEFFEDKEDLAKLRDDLIEKKEVRNKDFSFLRKDGSRFTGRLNLISEVTDKMIVETNGSIEDVTFKELLDEAPIGLYKVIEKDGIEVLQSLNTHFAELYGFENPGEAIDKPVADLHPNKESYQELIEALTNADAEGKILTNYPLRIYSTKGVIKEVLVTGKMLRSRIGNIKGRVGLIHDVTSDLFRRMNEWERDHAKFVHIYLSRIGMLEGTLLQIIEGHGSSLVKDGILDVKQTFETMYQCIGSFTKTFKNLQENAVKHNVKIGEDVIARTNARVEMTEKDKEANFVTYDNVRNAFIWIRNDIESIDTSQLRNEVVRAAKHDIAEVLRYSRLLSLNDLADYIRETYADITTFLKALTGIKYGPKEKKIIEIVPLLHQAKNSLARLAVTKSLKVNISAPEYPLYVLADKDQLSSVFYNILHNAIKYSWKKGRKDPYISISVSDNPESVIIKVENWGVAIKTEEIKSRSLFLFGSRGSVSDDRRRTGTGIGLWHSQEVVRDMKGSIEIDSNPSDNGMVIDYNRPFITVVTIRLPKKMK